MGRIISRRPLIGVVTGVIFGALGLLLTGMDRLPRAGGGAARIMYQVLGYFLLFSAALSFLSAAYALFKTFFKTKRQNPTRRH